MSKHWHPEGRIVRMRPVGRRKWTNVASYSASGRPATSGTTVGVVLFMAVSAGLAIGLEPSFWGSGPGEAIQTSGLPRAFGARDDAVRASFAFCHTGGGTNCVIDGDTFYLGGEKVRIAGIDAPETHPPRCAAEARLGAAATERLHALLNSGAVTMSGIDRDSDRYGRLLRNVAVDGQDVGEAMIGAGVAREYGLGRRGWCG